MSEEKNPTVVEAMTAAMRDVRSVKKSDTNSHFKFNFRGIDTVLDAVGPAFRSHGVVVTPELQSIDFRDSSKGAHVVVVVKYVFTGPAGDSIVAVVPGEAMDQQDKASSKAMSVAFRTALIQALAIPTGEPDPHSAGPVDTALASARAELKAAWAQDGRAWDEVVGEYLEWSKGAELGAATAEDLCKFGAAHGLEIGPKPKTVQRQAARKTGGRS